MDFLRRTWLLLALPQAFSWAVDAASSTTSGAVELNLIFPRNDTFAPSALTPVVFAIQNSHLVEGLDPTISWTIAPIDVYDSYNISGISHLYSINSSSSDPSFEYDSTDRVDAEGTWLFSWSLSFGNCSGDPEKGTMKFSGYNEGNALTFTTRNGARQPDLVAATNDNTCAKSPSRSWNVKDLLNVPAGSYNGRPSCAVVSSRTPTPNPCKVKVDSTAASSISTALTATACAALHPKVSCPAANNAAPRAQFPLGGAWLPAIFGWLAYTLV